MNHLFNKTALRCFSSISCIFALVLAFTTVRAQTNVPRIINYQGQITSSEGAAVNGVHHIVATLYSNSLGTDALWQGGCDAEIKNGIFTISLGSGASKLPQSSVLDRPLWIGISVDNGDELKPLTQFTTAPYALNIPDKSITSAKLADELLLNMGKGITPKPQTANGSDYWAEKGNNHTTPGTNYVGTSDSIALEIHINDSGFTTSGSKRVMRYEPNDSSANIIGGHNKNTIGGKGNIISGGGTYGYPNKISGNYDVVAGGVANSVTGNGSVISGDSINTISGNHSVISGGVKNSITGNSSVISGDSVNNITGNHSLISGGTKNTIGALYSNSDHSIITGGSGNTISGNSSIISGDSINTITGNHSVISGGSGNTITGNSSIISGDSVNTVTANHSNIAGGTANKITGDSSNIGGGSGNKATGHSSNISGGRNNLDSGSYNHIGGGYGDTVKGNYSAILGGFHNIITGDNSTILGGRNLHLGNKSIGFSANPNPPGFYLNVYPISNLAFFEDVDLWLVSDSLGYGRQLRFGCPYPSGLYTSFQAVSQAAYINYYLPGTQAPAGTISALVNDGTGVLSWDSLGAISDGLNKNWKITGNSNTDPTTGNFLGTNNNKAFEIHVNDSGAVNQGDKRVMGFYPNSTSANIVGGYQGNTISPKGFGNVIVGGGATKDSNMISSKSDSTLTNMFAFIGGGDGNVIRNDSDADERFQYGNVIVGGRNNHLEDIAAFIGGGEKNAMFDAGHGLIVGGLDNFISGSDYSIITGGDSNYIWGTPYAFIGGGLQDSIISSNFSTILSGSHNQDLSGSGWNVISGGDSNTISYSEYGSISGGKQNIITLSAFSAILSGSHNEATGGWSMVGSGDSNAAKAQYSAVVSGTSNIAKKQYSFVGSGQHDTADGLNAFIGGGMFNSVKGDQATIAGGSHNYAKSELSFIGGGDSNFVFDPIGALPQTAHAANILGGENLRAESYAQTVLGYYNKAQGTSHFPNNTPSFIALINPLDRVLIVGAGQQSFSGPDTLAGGVIMPAVREVRKNAFEVTNKGSAIVYDNHGSTHTFNPDSTFTVAVDSAIPVIKGARYVDNTCIAWATIDSTAIISGFGIDSIRHIGPTQGQYRIFLHYVYSDTDPNGTGDAEVNTLNGSSVTATLIYDPLNSGLVSDLCAEIRATPVNLGTNHQYQFEIRTYLPGNCTNVQWKDEPYMIHVFARP
jgi:hypothetical protein